MKIVSWNICYSRRNTGKYEVFAIKNRISKIIKLITEQNADIICLQEVHKSVKDEFEIFNNIYMLKWLHHSSRGGACYNLMAFRKDFVLEQSHVVTVFPSFINEYNGNKEIISCITSVIFAHNEDGTHSTAFVNVHSPMAKNIRFKINKILKSVTCENSTIICGDFNTFPDMEGKEQIANLCEINSVSRYTNNELTFRAYPYDIFESELPPEPLDHVFYRNMHISNFKLVGPDKTLTPDTCIEYESLQYFISDHFMSVFDIDI